jgi:5-methylthioadenosine/S-adenosylhomocysteine deaminase
VLYYVNLDRVLKPQIDGLFIELKSRTYSMKDAERKAADVEAMLAILGVTDEDVVHTHYMEMVEAGV